MASRTAWASGSLFRSGLWPPTLWSLAWNWVPSFSRSAVMLQYSWGSNFVISSSRYKINRRETVWTRPAERPVLMDFHKSGLAL